MSAAASRRDFLSAAARLAGAGLAAGGLGSLVAACEPGADAVQPHHLRLPAPNHPVTWPIKGGNRPIPGGRLPERQATLKVFAWADKVNPRCLEDFANKYGCQVELTTFGTFGQALATLQGSVAKRGHGTFDVLLGAPSYMVGRLVWLRLIQPLSHGYIPNIRQAWPFFSDPYYDSGWRYTVPYTVYTTGIAWRKDRIDLDPYVVGNGWNFPWLASGKVGKGKIAILEDYRASLGLAMLRNGQTDLNSTDPMVIDAAARALVNLSAKAGLRIDNATSRDLAGDQIVVHHAWSGQVAAAARYLPSGVGPDVLGYWFPDNGKGPVGNDTGTVLRGAGNPVLAHLLLNFLLDGQNALVNIARTGYVQPLTYVTPNRLIYEGILPRSLISTCVLSTYLDHSLKELQLPLAVNQLWRQAWHAVSHRRDCSPGFC